MTTSFYNGISGLKSYQTGIDIWGDNISNINTIGFKQNTPNFDTIYSDTLTGAISDDIGFGSTVTSTTMDTSQGNIIQTDNPFDIAISGDGWFEVSFQGSTYYTRNGAFSKDANGNLVNSDGAYLMVSSAGNIVNQNGEFYIDPNIDTTNLLTKPTTPISLPSDLFMPAKATTEATLKANLKDDVPLQTKADATTDTNISAAYTNAGNPINLQDGESFVYEVGEPTDYADNAFSREICFDNDILDGEDYMLDFSVNGVEINLTLPDGATKEDIVNALNEYLNQPNIQQQLQDKHITFSISNEGVTFNAPNSLIIKSNNDNVKSSAAAVLKYSHEPQENEFKTFNDLINDMQSLIDNVYEDVEVSFNDGKIVITNNSTQEVNSTLLKTDDTNDLLFENFGNLSSTIAPGSITQSANFYINNQTLGGYIYTADGEKKDMTFEFTKIDVNSAGTIWHGVITIDGFEPIEADFTFDTEGKLLEPKTLTFQDPPITLNLDLTNYSKVTEGNTFTQNGAGKGELIDYQIDSYGQIIATFDNATSAVVGQIPIFHFVNDEGLDNIGANLFTPTSNSGDPMLFKDANSNPFNNSQILSNSLENSNVNFSTAMTELIVTQKAFQAAAKTVTTSDQMIQKAIDMKR